MITQKEILLKARSRGVHLVTDEILSQLPALPQKGILHLFIKHTSAGLTINENADPSVRHDFEQFFDDMISEQWPGYTHTMEGADDMPAHLKATVFGSSLNIPFTNGRLNCGTWQGIYLGEFRNHAGARKIVVTIYS